MTAAYSCPPWCQQPAGHCDPEPGGPGDYHTAQIASIDFPAIPGLRSAGNGPLSVRVEQYVTAASTYAPVVATDFGDPGATRGGYECLTPEEAQALAWMLIRAATTINDAGSETQRTPPRPTTSGDTEPIGF